MATLSKKVFDRKPRDADAPAGAYAKPMINSVMNRGEWAILLVLALICWELPQLH